MLTNFRIFEIIKQFDLGCIIFEQYIENQLATTQKPMQPTGGPSTNSFTSIFWVYWNLVTKLE